MRPTFHRLRPAIRALRLLCLLAMVVVGPDLAGAQGKRVWVRGRVLLPDGTGAKGAVVSLSKSSTLPVGRSQKGTASGSVEVGLTGGFWISYVPGPHEVCSLTAKLKGYMPLAWNWKEHPSKGPKVLRARRFDRVCDATGSIVGRDGELLTEDWRVVATARGDRLSFQAASYTPFTLDSDTGEFRIGPLPAGPVELYALHASGARTETMAASLRSGEPLHVVLCYGGPDLNSSVRINADSASYPGLRLGGPVLGSPSELERSYLFLLNPDGSVLKEATQPEGIDGARWWFTDVPLGEHVAELRHPYFDPVRLEGVMAGTTHQVELVGSAEIVLEVLTSEGLPVDDYGLEIRYRGESGLMRASRVLLSGQPRPEDGRFDDIVPGNATLLVKGAGGALKVVELGFLEPGEARHVRVQLAAHLPMQLRPQLPVACTATLSLDGKPCRDARVVLVSQRRIERYEERVWVQLVLGNGAATDVDGRAEVTGLEAGRVYCAFAIGKAGSWIAPIGLVEGASYGEPGRLEASLELVEREVIVRRASGEPFPGTEFGWACRSITTVDSRSVTNSESKMTLRMPPGTYSLYRTAQQSPALVAFEWRAGEGALMIEMQE